MDRKYLERKTCVFSDVLLHFLLKITGKYICLFKMGPNFSVFILK